MRKNNNEKTMVYENFIQLVLMYGFQFAYLLISDTVLELFLFKNVDGILCSLHK